MRDRGPALVVVVLVTAVVAIAVVVALPGDGGAHRLPKAAGCPILPKSNHFNQRVDTLPRAGNSDTLVASIGKDDELHADFGSGTYDGGPIGIPYTVVSKTQKKVPVTFEIADESDRGPYPIPRNAPIEGGAAPTATATCSSSTATAAGSTSSSTPGRETAARAGPPAPGPSSTCAPTSCGRRAGHRPMPPGCRSCPAWRATPTSPRARSTTRCASPPSRTRRAYVYPARHYASDDSDAALPPMGLRVRLKANVSLDGLGRQAKVIARALKRYGALLADNGSPWFFSGAPDRRWDNDDLHTLDRITGSDFEVVDTTSLSKPR